MVTWGSNTTHVFGGTPAPSSSTAAPTTGFSFGSSAPAPAGGGLFGTSSTSASPAPAGGGLFGTPAPAPAGGGLFGSTPAPTSGGGLFGTTPAPASGGLFGSAPSGGLFGSTTQQSGGLFGSSTSGGGLFGTNPQQQQQQQQQPAAQQVPAHAALQALMETSARNEEARVLNRMQKIHQAYTGSSAVGADTSEKSNPFSIVLYNQATPQQRQLLSVQNGVLLQTDGHAAQLLVPPRPAQISEEDWNRACIRNPDPENYVPSAVVGAENLLSRAMFQQDQANTIEKHINTIHDNVDMLKQRQKKVHEQVEYLKQKHQQQVRRLLKVMKYVEVARCFNQHSQPAESEAQQRILHLKRNIIDHELTPAINQLSDPAPYQSNAMVIHSSIDQVKEIPKEQQQQWMTIVKEHRDTLAKLTQTVKKDSRDLNLIRDRVLATEKLSQRPSIV